MSDGYSKTYSFYIIGAIAFILIYIQVFEFDSVVEMSYQVYAIKTYFVFIAECFAKIFFEHFIAMIIYVFALIKARKVLLKDPFINMSLMGIFGAFIFVYIHEPNIPDMNQAITVISPILILVIALRSFPHINEKYYKAFVMVMMLLGTYNLLYFKIFPDKHHGLKGYHPAVHLSEEFKKDVLSYLDSDLAVFKGVTVRKNFTERWRENVSLSRWDYDESSPFHFVLMSPKIRTTIEVAPLFEGSIVEFCNNRLNQVNPYPFCPDEGEGISPRKSINILRKNKVTHLFIEDYNTFPEEAKFALKLICQDKVSGAGLWKLDY